MSGINGIFKRRGKGISEAAFYLSLDELAKSDIEERGSWISSQIALGHQKKSVLPEDRDEIFPVYDKEKKLVITSDARIDNRAELFDVLEIAQNERKNVSDARLILLCWEKWKRDCPAHLIGDYAFALWDEKDQTLFCARDHIGTKPFYYSLTSEHFIFASDLKALLSFPEVSDTLDEDFVLASLENKNFYLRDRTYFKDIRRLLPGSSLEIRKDAEHLRRFWFPENVKKIRFAKDEEYTEAAREIYFRAVNDRLRTEEKIGVHLSGGLDSSSIAVVALRERRERNLPIPEFFCWNAKPENSELELEDAKIKILCERENLAPNFYPADFRDILSILKKDPTREPVTNTLYLENTIQKAAAESGVRLILSGWGGDETLSFNGRGYYGNLIFSGRFLKLFREGEHIASLPKFIIREIILSFFRDRQQGIKKLDDRSLKAEVSLNSFLRPDLKNKSKLRAMPYRETSIRTTMLCLWNKGFLMERMESWAAHASALNIEYAYPMLDRRLMEFVIALPPKQFVRGKWRRWIMRQTVNEILPEEVCWDSSKLEPLRVEQSKSAMRRAFEVISEQLEATNKLPSRAKYFDMERLIKNLKYEDSDENLNPSDILRSLQFLDF